MDDPASAPEAITYGAQPAGEPKEWALVEIMGHREHWGEIKEVQRFGATLLSVLDADTLEVHFYGGASIFSITPVSEARMMAHVAEVLLEKKRRADREAAYEAQRQQREAARLLPLVPATTETSIFDLRPMLANIRFILAPSLAEMATWSKERVQEAHDYVKAVVAFDYGDAGAKSPPVPDFLEQMPF